MKEVLTRILEVKKKEVEALDLALLEKAVEKAPKVRDFKKALRKNTSCNIIAEFKRKSPSKGFFVSENTDVVPYVTQYEALGACAVSVLTDTPFFSGSLEDLRQAREHTSLPLLRKDFIFDLRQLYQARIAGADAVLLMMSVLKETQKLKALLREAERLELAALVEVSSKEEAEKALEAGAEIIGVNARSFKDLSVDINRVPPLLASLPSSIVKVAESGITSQEAIKKVAPYADALLIGTAFMEAPYSKIPEIWRHLTTACA